MQEFCIATNLGFPDNIVAVVPSHTVAIKKYSHLLCAESTKHTFCLPSLQALERLPQCQSVRAMNSVVPVVFYRTKQTVNCGK